MAHPNPSLLRKLRIGLNASIIFLFIFFFILAAIDAAKYPPDRNSSNAGNIPILILGPCAGIMVVWCSIDLLLHFVWKRNGIPRKANLPILVLVWIGVVICVGITAFFRGSHLWEETPYNLTDYVEGDEYFWPSWTFALISLIPHFVLVCVVSIQNPNSLLYVSSAQLKKNTAAV